MDITTWKSFKLSDLFNIKKGKRLNKQDTRKGNTPFVSAIDGNNGVRQYINKPAIHESNTITVNYDGSVGEAFYQPKPFWATDSVNVLYPKFNLNKYIGLFLTTVIRKEKYRFNYGRKWNTDRMNESTIKLPTTTDGKPDFEYMQSYIKSIMDTIPAISKDSLVNKELQLNVEKWESFKISDIFNITRGKQIDKRDMIKGNLPFVSAINGNNGVSAYINQEYISDGNTISVPSDGENIGIAYYQKDKYWASQHVHVLSPKFKLNPYLGMFLATIIRCEKDRFSFGRALSLDRIKELTIKLPTTADGKPDFEFMENYIKSLPYSASL